MPYYWGLALVIACSFLLVPAVSAQDSLRIDRGLKPLYGKVDYSGGAGSVQGRARVKPLEGRVERNAAGGLVDTANFQAGAGRIGLPGRANSNQIQGGAQQSSGLGQADSTPLRSGVAGMGRPDPFPLSGSQTRLPGDISDRELELLRSHDVVVIQDRSSSMGDKEHFPVSGRGSRKMSRWKWCLSQAVDLTRQTARIPGGRITLVLFSSQYDVYENVTLQQVPYIFARNKIFIGTKIVPPLADQLDRYFQRRDAGTAKPLVIAIITDAIPQDDDDLKDLIVETTHRMRNPDEITITILQVGSEEDGQALLRKLDHRMVRKGAKFDIVKTKTFPQVLQAGLTRSLIEAIEDGPPLRQATLR